MIPTWTFLTLLFAGIILLSQVTHSEFPYSIRQIIESYTMINGIGYVWIMLVYCFVAAGTPLIISAAKRSNMTAFPKIVTCGICVAIYEVLVYIITRKLDQNSEIVHVLKNTVPYFLAYSFIAAIPYFLKETKRLTKVLLGVACLALHYVMYFSFYSDIAINQVMSSRKFPPRMIYSLYAIGVSLILIELIKKRCKENKIMNTCCTFISKNSQWFYFNHIIMIYAWNMMFMNRFQQWWLMFIFVTFGATTLTLCMRKMADVVCEKSGAHITKIVKVIFG